jgi:hypothetical protein
MKMEQEKKYGIENLKNFLHFPISLAIAGEKAMADGKIDVLDLPHIVGPVSKLFPMLQAFPHCPNELKDLNEAEEKEIQEWAKKEFNLSNDGLEIIIEEAFRVAVGLAKLVLKLFNTKKFV